MEGMVPASNSPARSRAKRRDGTSRTISMPASPARPWIIGATLRYGTAPRRRTLIAVRLPLLDDVEDRVALDRPAAGLAHQPHELVHGHGLLGGGARIVGDLLLRHRAVDVVGAEG